MGGRRREGRPEPGAAGGGGREPQVRMNSPGGLAEGPGKERPGGRTEGGGAHLQPGPARRTPPRLRRVLCNRAAHRARPGPPRTRAGGEACVCRWIRVRRLGLVRPRHIHLRLPHRARNQNKCTPRKHLQMHAPQASANARPASICKKVRKTTPRPQPSAAGRWTHSVSSMGSSAEPAASVGTASGRAASTKQTISAKMRSAPAAETLNTPATNKQNDPTPARFGGACGSAGPAAAAAPQASVSASESAVSLGVSSGAGASRRAFAQRLRKRTISAKMRSAPAAGNETTTRPNARLGVP